MNKVACIYAITNLKDGSRYIGSAVDFHQRKSVHKHHLKMGTHDNRHLQRAWDRDGSKNFKFGIISVLNLNEELIPAEQAWLDSYQPEYNIARVAGNTLGCKRTDAAKQRISKANTGNKYCVGRTVSQETRDRIRIANTGRQPSLLEIEHHKQAWLNKSQSEQAACLANLELGRKPGRKYSEEAKRNMSLSKKGKPNLKLRGVPKSEEAKRKLSIAKTGVKLTSETKHRISVAQKILVLARHRKPDGTFEKNQ